MHWSWGERIGYISAVNKRAPKVGAILSNMGTCRGLNLQLATSWPELYENWPSPLLHMHMEGGSRDTSRCVPLPNAGMGQIVASYRYVDRCVLLVSLAFESVRFFLTRYLSGHWTGKWFSC